MTTAITLKAEELEGTEAQLSQWLVSVGDEVDEGQVILELETDKVSMEVVAPCSGVVTELSVKTGDAVEPDKILGFIGQADEASQSTQVPVEKNTEVLTESTVSERVTEQASEEPADSSILSPAVRRLIKEHDLELAQISGTGRGGRVTRNDVQNYLAAQSTIKQTQSQEKTVTTTGSLKGEKVPHSRMRKSIAKHMVTSLLHTAPHVTSVFEMDMTNIIEHRKWHKNECQRHGFKLTYTAYFAYAAALAAKEVPEVNARYHDDYLELFDQVNVGVGTALGNEGLVVPVIRAVENMSLYDIARALTEQTEKAHLGKLTPDDLKGSTLSISNHGVSGSLFATPIIINQPEVAILGIGKLEKRPVVREINGKDELLIKSLCYVSLTIDHRALDAFQTNRFLSRFVEIIESWQG